MWTQRHTRKEKDVKRQKEKIANCKPRSETWYRAFPYRPQREKLCQYLNLELLVSRTERQYISVFFFFF